MTLPAAPPIDFNSICTEFGLAPATVVFPRDFYSKGGAPASGNLSFADFLGRSAATFDEPPGTYSVDDPGHTGAASFTINASAAVVWNWTKVSGGPIVHASVASGSSATSITFSIAIGSGTASGQFAVSAGGESWTVNLSATAPGGGGA